MDETGDAAAEGVDPGPGGLGQTLGQSLQIRTGTARVALKGTRQNTISRDETRHPRPIKHNDGIMTRVLAS
jgi:hypothetical protein